MRLVVLCSSTHTRLLFLCGLLAVSAFSWAIYIYRYHFGSFPLFSIRCAHTHTHAYYTGRFPPTPSDPFATHFSSYNILSEMLSLRALLSVLCSIQFFLSFHHNFKSNQPLEPFTMACFTKESDKKINNFKTAAAVAANSQTLALYAHTLLGQCGTKPLAGCS